MKEAEQSGEMSSYAIDLIGMMTDSKIPLDERITQALRRLCEHYGWDFGVVYQTDGFRFFLREEVSGALVDSLPERLETGQICGPGISPGQCARQFFAVCGEGGSPCGSNLSSLLGAGSLFVRRAVDDKGQTAGFVIFACRSVRPSMEEGQMRSMSTLIGLVTQAVMTREYRSRGNRAIRTLESIMNNMGVDIYVNSFSNHDMLYANRSMAAPYGGWEHFEGKKCWQALYTDKTGECEFCPRQNIIDENGRPTKVYSWDYKRPFDGSWFRVFSAAFDWTDGQLAHVITSVDITHQKNIEEQLVIAKEKAERMDRQKSAFLANMGHEIRTPINAVVGFSELLPVTGDEADREAYIHIIKQNSELLMQLVNDILDLSRVESGLLKFEIEEFDLDRLCEEIALSYAIKDTRGVPVVFGGGAQCTLRSDRRRLQQVITNFINNAIKFTGQGSITLAYELRGDGFVEIWVRDTGTGIAEEKLEQVFERFVKLNEQAQGTGLGLSICRGIVEQLGGTIGVESTLGEGSRFWFTLPLHKR